MPKKKITYCICIIAAMLFAIALFVTFISFWSARAQLELRLAELKKAGEPTCLADLAREPIPPEQNGFTYMLQAKDDMNAVDLVVDKLSEFQENRFKPEEMNKIKDTLDAYPKIYPLLQQAAACPAFDFQINYKLPPSQVIRKLLFDGNASSMHSVKRYFRARALLQTYNGDRDEAMRSVLLLLQLTRQMDCEKQIYINYLIIIAIKNIAIECANEILQSGPIEDQTRAALDGELSLHKPIKDFQSSLKAERAYCLDSIKSDFGKSIFINKWLLSILDIFDELMECTSQPYSDCLNAEIMQQASTISKFTIIPDISKALLPGLKSTLVAPYRVQAMMNSLRIMNVLQKIQIKDGDRMPTMAELGLPRETGVDPFNGKKMIIKKLPDGWTVYSVGENLKDDGGTFDDKNTDVGFGPKIPIENDEIEKEENKSPE
jgi:hypothetical protein